MLNITEKFHIKEFVRKAMARALVDGDRCRYVTNIDGGLALRFNGFRVSDDEVELLFNGDAVASMYLPRRLSGDTLTVEGRDSMAGQYKVEIL